MIRELEYNINGNTDGYRSNASSGGKDLFVNISTHRCLSPSEELDAIGAKCRIPLVPE